MKTRYGAMMALMLLAGVSGKAWAQARVIAGRVTDSTSNNPITGAQVSVSGTRLSAFTDNQGNYEIGAPAGPATLTFRAIGYKAREVTVAPEESRVSAALARDVFNLEEVVVTGQATGVERRNLANAVVAVSAQDLAAIAKLFGAAAPSSSGATADGLALKGVVAPTPGVAASGSLVRVPDVSEVGGDAVPPFLMTESGSSVRS